MDPAPFLSTLPTELMRAILSSVSSINDLLSLILTFTHVYDSFRGAKDQVLSAVANECLLSGILAGALITQRCLHMRRTARIGRNRRSSIHGGDRFTKLLSDGDDNFPLSAY